MNMQSFNEPVLIITFNRPDKLKILINRLRIVRPTKIFCAIDGPRSKNSSDNEKILLIKNLLKNIDWKCNLEINQQSKNLGCRFGPISAITWFFSKVDRGIILEDDCIPEPSFFDYCGFSLKHFEKKMKVWHINGNNFGAKSDLYKADIEFVNLAQAWGWATWADRWKQYKHNVFDLLFDLHHTKVLQNRLGQVGRLNKLKHLYDVKFGLDAWDYGWQATILINEGLCVSPCKNLISNIGDGDDATHTKSHYNNSIALNLKTSPMISSKEFKIAPEFTNKQINDEYKKNMSLNSIRGAIKGLYLYFHEIINQAFRNVLCFFTFGYKDRIIVASTNCDVNEILSKCISDAAIKKISSKNIFIKFLQKFLINDNVDRISLISRCSSLVNSTYSLPAATNIKVKKIFVLGDPVDSINSIVKIHDKYGPIWLEKHLFHLESSKIPLLDFNNDILDYEKQVRSWLNDKSALIVHYDDLLKYIGFISNFLDLNLKLPLKKEKKPEKSSYKNNITYKRLLEIEKMAIDSKRYKSQFNK